ncbi:MAG TPA: hypothetical protein DET40_00170 [Lentisphaeria bacterium]|nr:MAG: hypothetical protein A2X45_22585 [Lentisphaerae bacterium GWF2_50_93]HCE41947.1 hypothetical protein [Lentisphaeria bacterium]
MKMKSDLALGSKVTMKEIADRLNLSKSTVSRAFTRPDLLDAKTVRRVLNSASRLKFSPNASARALSRGKTHLIAILSPTLNYIMGDFLTKILLGIQMELEKNDYSIVSCSYENSSGKGEGMFSKVLNRADVEGALIFAKSFSETQIEELASPPVPAVAVDIFSDAIPCVYSDNYQIGCTMAEHIVGMGHRRIACFMGPDDWDNSVERTRGVFARLKKHGIKVPQDWKGICRFPFAFTDSNEKMSSILSSCGPGSRPTAVIAANDEIGIGIYKAAAQHGLSVPGDISVIGCDNNFFCNYLTPPLTSIEQSSFDMGTKSALMLTGKLPAARLKCKHYVVARGSVRKLDAQL